MLPTIPGIPHPSAVTSPVIPNANNNLATALQAIPAPNIPMIPAAGSIPSMPTIAPIANPQQPVHMQQPVQLRFATPAGKPSLPFIPQYDTNATTSSRNLDNVGKRWSKDEEAQVVSFLMRSMSIANIASNIGRTPRSVKMRILQILNNKFTAEGVYDGRNTSEGWTASEACHRYQVTHAELLEFKSQAAQSSQSSQGSYNNSNYNNARGGLSLPALGAIPQLPQLGTPTTTITPTGITHTFPAPAGYVQAVPTNSVQSNPTPDPILVEIRDLLLAMNRKLDVFNGTTPVVPAIPVSTDPTTTLQ